jgi:hypothetical protein
MIADYVNSERAVFVTGPCNDTFAQWLSTSITQIDSRPRYFFISQRSISSLGFPLDRPQTGMESFIVRPDSYARSNAVIQTYISSSLYHLLRHHMYTSVSHKSLFPFVFSAKVAEVGLSHTADHRRKPISYKLPIPS